MFILMIHLVKWAQMINHINFTDDLPKGMGADKKNGPTGEMNAILI